MQMITFHFQFHFAFSKQVPFLQSDMPAHTEEFKIEKYFSKQYLCHFGFIITQIEFKTDIWTGKNESANILTWLNSPRCTVI